ncbi:HET-domain-containing protein [Apiospora rasikravindrae]|uniref:HET-domain-containing protein n=1 Tax=Apiospora rasikravindrae TaxID=990691 RepID=A0ABR1SFS4_9PEZI
MEFFRERNLHLYGMVDMVPYISVLAVRPVGQTEKEVPYRSILPHSVDIDFIKRNIKTCVNEHESCRTSEEQADGLNVIDCRSQKVVPAPVGCQYIALSYVWGAKPEDATVGFPQVVQDSIRVTKALGCRYIWVDRYCIDQEDTQKQHIFNQMHRVYSNAFLTIIAGAGRDAHHGLPGVSSGRPKQIKFQLGNLQFDEVFPSNNLALTNSAWATRAWTYQESYFSRRRLCFTEKQVLWICNDCTQAECISSSSRGADHVETPVPLRRHKHVFIIGDMQYDICLYTARLLSYPSDSLNAILGVLQYYVELTTEPQHCGNEPAKGRGNRRALASGIDINHAWGVPLYRERQSQEIMFDVGWRHLKPGTRRPEFPSWSWAGWAGQIHFLESVVAPDMNWSFMTNRHIEVPRDAFHNQTVQGDDAPRGLVITTKVCPVTLWDNSTGHMTNQTTSSKFRVVFQLTETVYAGTEWAPDEVPDEVPDVHGDYLAASFWHKGEVFLDRYVNSFTGQMILRRRDQDFERIGISHMPKVNNPDWFYKNWTYFDAAGNILDLSDDDKEHLKEQDGHWWWYEHAETQRICIF